jgi:hypothetical protein
MLRRPDVGFDGQPPANEWSDEREGEWEPRQSEFQVLAPCNLNHSNDVSATSF